MMRVGEAKYDDAGNLEDPGDPSAFDYDANNRILTGPSGTSWTFDDDGNIATRTVGSVEERFTYDRSNRLRAWEKGPTNAPIATATYFYDPFGRRIQKTIDGTTTWFVWDGYDLLAEFHASGTRDRRYAYAGGFAPVELAIGATATTESTYYIDTDHLDAPRLAIDAASELPAWRASYRAYGDAVLDAAISLNVRLPGQYYDSDTKLHYNRFRYYDPAIGRYVSADPIGQFAMLAMYGTSLSRIGFNGTTDLVLGSSHLFEYGFNSPTNLTDPQGEGVPLLLLIPATGGLLNGGASALIEAKECDANALGVLAAFGRGFAAGFVGTSVGLATALGTKNPALIGASAGLSANLTEQALSGNGPGDLNATEATVSTVAGAAGGSLGRKIFRTQGRLPSLTTPRGPSNFGKNSARLLGQEATAGAVVGAAAGAAASAQGGEECGCP